MAIVGIGTDLVRITKIGDLHRRFGRRFENRIFTEQERAYCLSRSCPEVSLAARFAAKEALFKALGTGKTPILRWTEVAVERDEAGRPTICVSGKTKELLAELGADKVHVSLTHTEEHASAFVILERCQN
jgi:holo-[acyl-carrier protein] synthase